MDRILFPVALALIMASSLQADQIPVIKDATPEKFFGGTDSLRIVQTAKEITVFSIVEPDFYDEKDKPHYKNVAALISVDDEKCTPSPKTISGPDVARVASALTNVRNFGEELMCDFDPGIILRFRNSIGILDVIVCFHCGEMVLYRDTKIVHRNLKWAEAKNTFFRPAGHAFAAVAKDAFPDDAEISALRL